MSYDKILRLFVNKMYSKTYTNRDSIALNLNNGNQVFSLNYAYCIKVKMCIGGTKMYGWLQVWIR